MGKLLVTVTTTETATIDTGSIPAHAIASVLEEKADDDFAGWLNDWSLDELTDKYERKASITTEPKDK